MMNVSGEQVKVVLRSSEMSESMKLWARSTAADMCRQDIPCTGVFIRQPKTPEISMIEPSSPTPAQEVVSTCVSSAASVPHKVKKHYPPQVLSPKTQTQKPVVQAEQDSSGSETESEVKQKRKVAKPKRTRDTKAELEALYDVENPKPSTSAALARHQERIAKLANENLSATKSPPKQSKANGPTRSERMAMRTQKNADIVKQVTPQKRPRDRVKRGQLPESKELATPVNAVRSRGGSVEADSTPEMLPDKPKRITPKKRARGRAAKRTVAEVEEPESPMEVTDSFIESVETGLKLGALPNEPSDGARYSVDIAANVTNSTESGHIHVAFTENLNLPHYGLRKKNLRPRALACYCACQGST